MSLKVTQKIHELKIKNSQVHKNNLKAYHARGVETPMPDSQIDPIKTKRAYNKKIQKARLITSSSESSADESAAEDSDTETNPIETPVKKKTQKKIIQPETITMTLRNSKKNQEHVSL